MQSREGHQRLNYSLRRLIFTTLFYPRFTFTFTLTVCLEMFNCVPAEQTVAMRKAKFLKRVNNSNNMLCQTFAVEAAKELATL